MAMIPPFAVRPIEEGDAPLILLLARTLDKWFNVEGLRTMAKDLETHAGFVAVRGDRVLGFVTWEPIDKEVANMSWIGVAETEQRSGIGRALLAALKADLRRRGFRTIEVSTVAESVDYEPYAATRRFYRAMGFVDYRVDPLYFGEGEGRYDRLRMRLQLTSPEPTAPA